MSTAEITKKKVPEVSFCLKSHFCLPLYTSLRHRSRKLEPPTIRSFLASISSREFVSSVPSASLIRPEQKRGDQSGPLKSPLRIFPLTLWRPTGATRAERFLFFSHFFSSDGGVSAVRANDRETSYARRFFWWRRWIVNSAINQPTIARKFPFTLSFVARARVLQNRRGVRCIFAFIPRRDPGTYVLYVIPSQRLISSSNEAE